MATRGERVVNTGGARGCDYLWAKMALENGVKVNVFTFEGHKPYVPTGVKMHRVDDTPAEARERARKSRTKLLEEVAKLNGVLHYVKRAKEYTRALLERNAAIAIESDCVVGIGFKTLDKRIQGGTMWACMGAYLLNKPVFFFEQNAQRWFRLMRPKMIVGKPRLRMMEEPPDLSGFQAIGAVGSRHARPTAQREIRALMEQLRT